MAKTKKSSVLSRRKKQESPVQQPRKDSRLLIKTTSGQETNLKIKKVANADTLALEKSEQKQVSKQTKRLKKGIEDGTVVINPSGKELKQKAEEKRGLVYIAHLPHGFYEDEMSNYFKQFGKVTNVKVCRSSVSGNSKGFGYIEFLNPEVAKIAAETMNNYVMFKKRIVTAYVPYEKRPKGLFHGKSSTTEHTSVQTRRGKQKHSRNKIQDDKLLEKKTKRIVRKLQSKMSKLKNLGIQCDIVPVDISSKLVKKIKLEKKSRAGLNLSKCSTQEKHLHLESHAESTNPCTKSVSKIKSNKAMLTKSLDSVKKILVGCPLSSQDEETQTPRLRAPKKERNILKGGIVKATKNKNPVVSLKPDTIRKIARELIRKRGTPLLTLKPTKPKANKKQK